MALPMPDRPADLYRDRAVYHSSLTSISRDYLQYCAFFVLCPALIMLAVGSRNDFNETDLPFCDTGPGSAARVSSTGKLDPQQKNPHH